MTRRIHHHPLKPGPMAFLRRSSETGATSSEYALIAALVAVVIIAAVALLGTNTLGLFDRTASSVSSVAGLG